MDDPLFLAIDASMPRVSLALGRKASGMLKEQRVSVDARMRSHLAHSVKALLDQAGALPTDLRGILVGRGPGNFSALRSAHAFARGFTDALHLPLYGWSSMLAAAASCEHDTVAVLHDARRNEVFLSVWERDVARLAPVLLPREEAVPAIANCIGTCTPLLVGTALDLLDLSTLPASWPRDKEDLKPAMGLLRLWQRTPEESLPLLAEPDYLRPPDAKEPPSPTAALAALREAAANRLRNRSR